MAELVAFMFVIVMAQAFDFVTKTRPALGRSVELRLWTQI